MKFTEKNNFIVKHKSKVYFDKDLELFKQHCSGSPLHVDLKRVNSFTMEKLDGMMLYELLEKCTPEEILKNRGIETQNESTEIINSNEEVILLFKDTSIDLEDFNNETLSLFIGKKKEEIIPFIDFLDKIYKLGIDTEIDAIDTTEEVKKIFDSEFTDDSYPSEAIDQMVGKTEGEIRNYINFAKTWTNSTKHDLPTEKETVPQGTDEETPGADSTSELDEKNSTKITGEQNSDGTSDRDEIQNPEGSVDGVSEEQSGDTLPDNSNANDATPEVKEDVAKKTTSKKKEVSPKNSQE
ncbi:hypothetical protein D0T49_01950 [Paludibacter sp. 221]|uniref:hypothetical protein n=1 Tax=Paludibacter sp. 221 TaxID=2302939 RepID=UPI0013D0FFFB|nr:hypothetical protein [Paludibacter sp. 221]NDV45813.1 hypothetical protein [Paludibacter sp. 221]